MPLAMGFIMDSDGLGFLNAVSLSFFHAIYFFCCDCFIWISYIQSYKLKSKNMKLVGIIFSSISLILSSYGLDKSPNFLFIFADDMAYETINAYGLTDIDTPNLDRLVKSGTSFSRAYNMGAWNGAVCIAENHVNDRKNGLECI